MDDRALIDEYRAWCAAHLHPRRGATLVRALEDVVSAELKRGDPSRLVERMRAGALDQAAIAAVVERRGPATVLGQRDARRYGSHRAVELALRHFVACAQLRRARPGRRAVSAEELAFFDDGDGAEAAAAAPGSPAPAAPAGPQPFRDAFDEAQYVLEEAVAAGAETPPPTGARPHRAAPRRSRSTSTRARRRPPSSRARSATPPPSPRRCAAPGSRPRARACARSSPGTTARRRRSRAGRSRPSSRRASRAGASRSRGSLLKPCRGE